MINQPASVDQRLELWVECHEEGFLNMTQEEKREAVKELNEIMEEDE